MKPETELQQLRNQVQEVLNNASDIEDVNVRLEVVDEAQRQMYRLTQMKHKFFNGSEE